MTQRKRPRPARAPKRPRPPRESTRVVPVRGSELAALRAEVKRKAGAAVRWNANPEDVQKSIAQLVLALVEFLRKLLERQAIRRMEAGTLDDHQIENVGLALMKLEEAVRDLAGRFGLEPEDLNLDLGPLGRLH
jgi:hypothetical protein